MTTYNPETRVLTIEVQLAPEAHRSQGGQGKMNLYAASGFQPLPVLVDGHVVKANVTVGYTLDK